METIIQESLPKYAKRAWSSYAKYIIENRAIPDVRDGMIPVKRRIVWSMYLMPKVGHDKPRVKSARSVGDVMGKYHPHGDSSIYDAMVRMAQDFKSNMVFLDPKGNWGGIIGHPAAHMRYTEIRPSELMLLLTKGLEKDTVEMAPNFDGSEMEPVYLPAVVPNILINGHTGIAVGINSILAPHNVDESIDACILMLDNPQVTLEEVMEVMPGPDFPMGGYVPNALNLKNIYATGSGPICNVGSLSVDEAKKTITIEELPYSATWVKIKEELLKLEDAGRINDVREVKEGKDKMTLYISRNGDVNEVANTLRSGGVISTDININMLVITKTGLKKASLLSILSDFVEHRIDVTKRSIQHDINIAQKRKTKLEANLFLVEHREAVIEILKESETKKDAVKSIIELGSLSQAQGEYILGLQIMTIVKEEVNKVRLDMDKNEAYLEGLQEKLGSDKAIRSIIRDELKSAKNGVKRKTKLEYNVIVPKKEEKKVDENVVPEVEDKEIEVLLPDGEQVTVGGNHIITLVKDNGIIQNIRAANWDSSTSGMAFHDHSKDHFVVLKNGVMGRIPLGDDNKEYVVSPTREEGEVLGVFPSIDFTHLVVLTNKGRFAAVNAENLLKQVIPISLITMDRDEYIQEAYRVDNKQGDHCVVGMNSVGEYFKTDLSTTSWMDYAVPIDSIPFSKNSQITMRIVNSNAKIKVKLSDGKESIINLAGFVAMSRESETCKYKMKGLGKAMVVEVMECSNTN